MQGRRSDDSLNELAMQGAPKMSGARVAVQSSTLTIDRNAAMIRPLDLLAFDPPRCRIKSHDWKNVE